VNGDEERLRLQAALDGELDASGMLAFEHDCAANPALATRFSRAKALDLALRDAMPIEPAPPYLREKVAALAAPQRRGFLDAPPYALAASLLVGVLAGFAAGQWRAPPSEERALVSAFMRAQIGGAIVDIANSDRHVVKPWLAQRAPLSVTAVDLSASGFSLAGGRVEALGDRIAPTLVYSRREHRIDLTELPLAGGAGAPGFSSLDGFHVARWADADRSYVAVTDLPEIELADFVSQFRAATAKEREGAK
jgi:anti-sigma factor RsiW